MSCCDDCNCVRTCFPFTNLNGREVELCKECLNKPERRAGKFKFLGRWRTPEEAAQKIADDRAYRGVKWTLEGDTAVGRDGAFEVRLYLTKQAAT